jgi:hypothetical protein
MEGLSRAGWRPDRARAWDPTDAIPLSAFQNSHEEIRNGSDHPTKVLHHAVRLELQLGRELGPLMGTDVAEPVLASNFHRELELLRGGLPVRKRARNIVQWGEPCSSLCTDEDGVVLRVCVGPADDPIQDQRLNQDIDVFLDASRVLGQEIDDGPCARTTVGLVLECGSNAERRVE